ncbi:hypothetical protein KKB11_00130 [Candidatus Micrarchaeota archaeon]|nr:hypothetical protein [Candidatus Micrarchaeota archaeon]
MDRKGFTLFTALVSFVLILLSAMLVQTMIKAERDRTEVISNIQEQAEMQAMADLTRAEALQTFNYIIRKEIETYFNYNNRKYPLIIYPQDHNFSEIRDDFAQRFFGAGRDSNGTQFVNQMAITLTSSLPQTKFVGPYTISIKLKKTQDETEQEILFGSLKKMFDESVEEGEFFEVVECKNGNPEDCKGTFYLNLKLADLDDTTYESFPQIKVYNPRTGRVLQESIFPKADLRLYVPIRLFKAIAEARALALEYEKEQGSSWRENYGLFSPRIHNEIEEMKLGMCDPGYCNVRSDPFVAPKEKNMAEPCPNTVGNSPYDKEIYCPQIFTQRGINCTTGNPTGFSYDPNIKDNQEKTLENLVEINLCAISKENYKQKKYFSDGSFQLTQISGAGWQGCEAGEEGKILILADTTTKNSVKINPEINTGSVTPGDPIFFPYNANEDIGSKSSNCPMTSSANSSLTLWGSFGIGIEDNRIVKKAIEESDCLDYPAYGGSGYVTCSEVTKIRIRVPFKETDQKYIINKSIEPVYVIELVDNKFNSASSEFHQEEKFSVDTSTCGLTNSTSSSAISCNIREWQCNSFLSDPGTPGISPAQTGGCEVP